MTTICGKHHKQAQETYKANKAKAIQIIIVYCDFFVIQYTITNLWRKILAQALELNRNSLQQGYPEKAIQVVSIDCDLVVTQSLMKICGNDDFFWAP